MTNNEIDDICYQYDIINYKINKDKTIDVYDHVDIIKTNLTEIPLNFNVVTGNFLFECNTLKSLKGSPKRVDGFFDVSYLNLKSLKYSPEYVGGDLSLEGNKLTTLKNIPKTKGQLFLHENNLRTFNYLENVKYLEINENPVEELWNLFKEEKHIEYFNELDIITPDEKSIVLERLNYFLTDIGGYEIVMKSYLDFPIKNYKIIT